MASVYVFDLDGVLYRGAEAVPGAADCLKRLRDRGKHLFFLTNNSTQSRADYVAKLTGLGMPCDESEVVTSASATAAYLILHHNAAGKSALVVGGQGLMDELTAASIHVTDAHSVTLDRLPIVDFVIVGLDHRFDYAALTVAQQTILNGALFVATNRDGQYPVEGGKVIPGAGSVVVAIATAANREPITIGKPEPHGLQTILEIAGVLPNDALMIGDRLDTDILCGNRLNVPTVLVLTGVSHLADVEVAAPEMHPSTIINDLTELEP